ncbi:MAG: RelA/SpoT domain-containing protein [Tyzzerella sp.]|nr:RelA/SpoT domain-containing protein [Tyzzerella sp.]
MAIEIEDKFDLDRIKRKFNISERYIMNSPVKEKDLEEIYNDFQANHGNLEQVKNEILGILNSRLDGEVHSIRCRVKDADHLIEKIIRNINKNPDKYSKINIGNYNKIITDLIGVRIIILDKRDWKNIHNSLLTIFRNIPDRYVCGPEDIISKYDEYKAEANPKTRAIENLLAGSYHAEKPVVYITSPDDKGIYVDEFLKVDDSKTKYRSIHYIIRYRFVYFEIQVRTLFEEGWLEFDHRILYPYDQNNPKKREYAAILSSLAVAADSLISFYEESCFQQEQVADEEKIEKSEIEEIQSEEQNLSGKMKQIF